MRANRAMAEHLGLTPEECLGAPCYRVVHGLDSPPEFCPHAQTLKDGCEHTAEVTEASLGGDFLVSTTPLFDTDGSLIGSIHVARDITERRNAERERETIIEFLRLVNETHGTDGLIHAATRFFRDRSGCEAVGVRLRDGEDYPYYETHGFPEEFVRMEKYLCVRTPDGKPLRGHDGYPIMECMCGNVIQGRFDPSKPFFTARGSFWSNDTTALLATTSEEDRQARTRNRCNGEGYESVALIALRAGDECLGLLQFNDRRKGRFTPQLITLWERFADYLAVALAKNLAEDGLRESEKRFAALASATFEGIVISENGRYVDVNDQLSRMLGFSREELLGMEIADRIPPAERDGVLENIRTGRESHIEHGFLRKDGSTIIVEAHGRTIDFEDRKLRFTAIRDITERKRMEDLRTFLAQTAGEIRGETFFHALARYLAVSLDMNFVCIDRLEGDGLNATTLAVWSDGHFEDNVTYALKDTPCGDVVGKQVCCFPASVCQFFPKDDVLRDLHAESYIGATLWSHDGRPIGLIAVIGRGRLANRPLAETMLKVVSLRAGAELERQDAETALRESEERLRTLGDNLPEGALYRYVHDPEGRVRFEFISAGIERMLGVSPEDIVRDAGVLDGTLAPAARRMLALAEEQSRERLAPFEMELEQRHAITGDMRWSLVRSMPHRRPDGSTVWDGVQVDITERKRAEERVYDLNLRLQALMEAVPVGISYSDDPSCSHITGNPAVLAQFGVTQDDNLSASAPDDSAPGRQVLFFKDGQFVTDQELPLQRAVAENRVIESMELEVVLPNGHRWYCDASGAPVHDAHGNVVGGIAVTVDITARKQAEMQLEEMRHFLSEGQRIAHMGSWQFIAATEQTVWSEEECRIYGLPPGASSPPYDVMLRDFIHPDYRDLLDTAFRQAVSTGSVFELEHRIIRADGAVRVLVDTGHPYFDDDGKLVKYVGTTLDITERKQAEEALRQSEERYRSLFGTMMEGFCIAEIFFDDDGKAVDLLFLETNNSFAEQTGFGDAQGRRLRELAPDLEEYWFEVCGRVATTGVPMRFESEARPLGKWYEVHAYRVGTPEQRRVAALFNDITARRRSQDELEGLVHARTLDLSHVNEALSESLDQHRKTLEALRESTTRLAEAQRMAHLGNWNWDFAQKTVHWSDETFRLLGFEPWSLIPSYKLFLQRVYPDDRESVDSGLRRALADGVPYRDTFRVLLPNEDIRHLAGQAEMVLDDQGRRRQFAGTLMDITEQVQAREEAKLRNQQLLQADKMVSLGILTSGVAHEINNPNHAIMSNTTLVLDAWTSIRPILEQFYGDFGDFVVGGLDYSRGRDEFPRMLKDVLAASRRIEAIVTELRDFARHSPEDTLSPIEIGPVIESASVLLSSMIKRSTDYFTVSCQENLPKVMANRQRIEQVLINLMQNACQSLPSRDKRLAISTAYDEDKEAVVIVIEDEGSGIQPENLKHLGDPFFTTKRHFGGTGLGLWVSFNIVREHRGLLQYYSTPGQGTRAVLTLRATL